MIAYVVTEGPFDVDLLSRLVPQHLLEDVVIVPAGGLSAVKSFARSLLVRRQTPVAIFVDADAASPEIVRERRQSVEEVVEVVAGNIPVKVILAVPSLETILTQSVTRLEHTASRIYAHSQLVAALTDADIHPCNKLDPFKN